MSHKCFNISITNIFNSTYKCLSWSDILSLSSLRAVSPGAVHPCHPYSILRTPLAVPYIEWHSRFPNPIFSTFLIHVLVVVKCILQYFLRSIAQEAQYWIPCMSDNILIPPSHQAFGWTRILIKYYFLLKILRHCSLCFGIKYCYREVWCPSESESFVCNPFFFLWKLLESSCPKISQGLVSMQFFFFNPFF